MSVKTTEPEILPPGTVIGGQQQRLGGAGGAFRDENLDMLSRIPGFAFREHRFALASMASSDSYPGWEICWVV
jgi:hypothetical protein